MSTLGSRALRVGLGAALIVLLAAFGRHVDWHGVGSGVRSADPWLLVVACVMNQLSLALKGVRWWVFLRPLGVRSLWLVLRATFAGASLNNLVVAQGGEGARALIVSRATGVSSARVLSALALERMLDMVSYLALLTSAAWLLDLPDSLLRWRSVAGVSLAIAVAGLIAIGVAGERASVGDDAVRDNAPIGRFRSYLRRFIRGVSEVASLPRLSAAMGLSLGAWALQVATYHLIARAGHLPVTLAGSVSAMLSVGMSFLIRATPGNVGVFQAVYALTLRSFGIAEGPAIAAALLIQAVQVIPTVIIGMIAAPRGDHVPLTPNREPGIG